jgi:cytochrome c-type biogenesis protein
MTFIYEGLVGLEAISPYVYLLVFLGGIVSALSICYIPILIMFSGYMSGRAQEGTGKALRLTTSFTIGMVITSAIIGIIAAYVGRSIMDVFTNYSIDVWIPASIGIVMGLQLLGVIRLRMPKMLRVKKEKPETTFGAFALGLPFGLVITPCTIPIFIMIITYVAVNGDMLHGALLLTTYAIGKGIVLAIVSTTSVSLFKDVAKKWSGRIEKIAGVIIILISLYLIFFQIKMAIPSM